MWIKKFLFLKIVNFFSCSFVPLFTVLLTTKSLLSSISGLVSRNNSVLFKTRFFSFNNPFSLTTFEISKFLIGSRIPLITLRIWTPQGISFSIPISTDYTFNFTAKSESQKCCSWFLKIQLQKLDPVLQKKWKNISILIEKITFNFTIVITKW